MRMIQATMPMPTAKVMALVMAITSNMEPGIPYDGVMGPFIIGNNLTITCSTEKSQALSWWEGDKQLETFNKFENGVISCNFIVGTLQAEDSHRHFTCRELVSGTEKSVDLHLTNDIMEIQRDGHSLKNEETVKVYTGTNFSLDCIVYGSNPSTGSWWEGETKLASNRTKSPKGINSQLAIGPARIEDNGRKLTCRARNGQLTKTVILNVVKDEQRTVQSPITHAPSTKRTHAKKSSADTVQTQVKIATDGEDVITSTQAGGVVLVAGTASQSNSVATTTTGKPQDSNDMKMSLIGLVVALLAVCVVLVLLTAWILTKVRTINKQDISTSPQHDGISAAQSPHLPRPPMVEEGEETASSGGRMSAMRPDDRDHSYYYPDLINNSYYYPKITDDVKQTLLLTNSGQ